MSKAKVMGVLSFTTVVQLYNGTYPELLHNCMMARRKEVLAFDCDMLFATNLTISSML